ncbi:DUF3060 domain-containing protein [Candidatus Pacearchaeota archaeon]|nr:DUF3060 domain-containing protein [Candidatus Pacearchaeota archaeon]
MEEDKIKISGEDNKIIIDDGEKIEIKGDDNVVRVQDVKKVEIKGDDNIIQVNERKDIKESLKDIKSGFKKALNLFQQKKALNILIMILLIIILIGGTWIRLQNLPLLVDSTTGENIPLALDPFYFLRVAETMISEGGLPDADLMRYPSLNLGYTNEFTPRATVGLYKFFTIFNPDVSIQFVNVVSPVIFFLLGLIAFFFLIFVLTKSKITALISTGFLAIIPMYLYRTLAGFSDHESIGMFSFFLVLLVYALSINFLDKKSQETGRKNNNLIKISLLGIATAFFSAFNFASWSGIATFTFIIIPLSFLLIWLFKEKNNEENKKNILKNYLVFYLVWFLFTAIFSTMYGFSLVGMFNHFISGTNILVTIVLLFIFIDYFLIINKKKYLKGNLEKYRVLISGGIMLILGAIILFLLDRNLFTLIFSLLSGLLDPFGESRIGSTVAENAQPYLIDWMNQVGKFFFWFFYLGMAFLGFEISKGVKKKNHKIIFSLTWILLISGILFSRISETSLFNGFNNISKLFYFISILIFVIYFIWLYFNEKVNIKSELLIIVSWLFFILVAGRGAIRFFFIMAPFICFMVGYFSVKLFEYFKKSKDELLKLIVFVVLILVVIGLISSVFSFTGNVIQQAKYTGPSANLHWQKAMSWVRDNTPSESIFVHWWDYGYWVQYLGERPTITDGGHGNAFWDHLIGRYVLTTPYPETALSFMKAHDVSYLLIDPTDIGKYSAYSKIGSDATTNDRYSMIPTFLVDSSQTQETSDKELRIFSSGGAFVDEDIIFNQEGKDVFLPSQKTVIGGIILEINKQGTSPFDKVYGVFFYNGEQFQIPLRYVYYEGVIIDLGEGLETVAYFIPSISSNSQGVGVDQLGAVIYLSPQVMNSLVGQLYILNDAFDNYPGVNLVHSEPSLFVDNLNNQGLNLNEFVYYQGIQGPIKIWEINHQDNIIARQEFLNTAGEYAEYDNLKFIK